MIQVVIGAGEVGRAIADVLGCEIRDIDGEPHPADVLHICYPWSDTFIESVEAYREQYHPSLVIVHSTVPVGTCRKLGAVHSPVTGKHPNLAESVRTFVKFVGGPGANRAAAIFRAAGVKTETVRDSETTEAGKLWATLQYGWLIALQKEAYRFCREVGADPDIAYRRFNEVYSAGYEAMGEPYRLPILRDIPGKIGGHCVIPNTRFTPTRLAEWLAEMDGDW